VRAADSGQARPDDGDPSCRRGAGPPGNDSGARERRTRGGCLGEQPTASQPALGDAILPLTGYLVDRHLAPLGFRVNCEQFSEVARRGRVRLGARSLQ
jgi:hypothetical protein